MAEPRQFLYIWKCVPEFFKAIDEFMEGKSIEDHRQIMEMYNKQCFPDMYEDLDPDAVQLGRWDIPWEVSRRVHFEKVDGKHRIVDIPPTKTQQAQASGCKPAEAPQAAQLPCEFIFVPHPLASLPGSNLSSGPADSQDSNNVPRDVIGKLFRYGDKWALYVTELHLEAGNDDRGAWVFEERHGVLEPEEKGVVFTLRRCTPMEVLSREELRERAECKKESVARDELGGEGKAQTVPERDDLHEGQGNDKVDAREDACDENSSEHTGKGEGHSEGCYQVKSDLAEEEEWKVKQSRRKICLIGGGVGSPLLMMSTTEKAVISYKTLQEYWLDKYWD
ncbi:uncharacterized protein PAC_03352 [Phialocephala subalpina]|uniref:Uncharacterized protein n=1 Tax=Phialocephala subalpina TaxID=576137 RepID=A0A1L7WL61_9HELO|nr:uncharacterized protein PAC_03352 [Phialocephala subalpina]